jgi:hypothetical protein
MRPAFVTATGRLTAYALACGYLERHEQDGVRTTLWAEHGVYHVRQHDVRTNRRMFWGSFTTITDARRRYDIAIRKGPS